MRYPKKRFVIPVDVFDADVRVFLNFGEADIERHFRALPKLPLPRAAIHGWDTAREAGRAFEINGTPIVIFRFTNQEIYKVAAVVAHEMLHATFELLGRSGVKHAAESEEVHCYLMDYLIGETLRQILGSRSGKRGRP